MTQPERSRERDAAIDAVLPHVSRQGWTLAALRDALRDIGADPEDATLLFPRIPQDLIEAYIDLVDRRMSTGVNVSGLRVSDRVRALIAYRLESSRAHKDAIRRAVAVLSLPLNAGLAARTLARTVDAIWHAAGDRSADFAWYTKRATLAGVYSATLLFWLRDYSEGDVATLAFLDRRLASVGRVAKLRKRLEQAGARVRRVAMPCRRADRGPADSVTV